MSCNHLAATTNGTIYDADVSKSVYEEANTLLELKWREVHSFDESTAVKGLTFCRYPRTDQLYLVPPHLFLSVPLFTFSFSLSPSLSHFIISDSNSQVVTTPTRLYQFVGPTGSDSFADVFSANSSDVVPRFPSFTLPYFLIPQEPPCREIPGNKSEFLFAGKNLHSDVPPTLF